VLLGLLVAFSLLIWGGAVQARAAEPVTTVTDATTLFTIQPVTTEPVTTEPVTTVTEVSTTETTDESTVQYQAGEASARYEQTDSRLAYAGTWYTNDTTPAASEGSFEYANVSGTSVTVRFTGTYLAWITKTGPLYGIAQVTVDGTDVGTVDLYSPTDVYQQKVWETTLPSGTHSVTIRWTGTANTAAAGTYIGVDAFDVLGALEQAYPPVLPPTPARCQQTDCRLLYAGTWYNNNAAPSASGGSFRYSNNSGASVTVEFTGTYLAWVAKTSPLYGIAEVTLDEGAPVTVDLYSATDLWQQRVWETGVLTSGAHTVTIQWTGGMNLAATDSYIGVDAFEVVWTLEDDPALAPTPTRYEQTHSRLVYGGTWCSNNAAPSASGGSFRYTDVPGASVTVTFTGTYLAWIARMSPLYGYARVTLDGGTPVMVDLYSPDSLFQQKVWSTGTLPSGAHTVRIEWTGSTNPAAMGSNISVDAFDIAGLAAPPAGYTYLTLRSGSTGAAVKWLEQRLTDLSYRPGPIDGVFDQKTYNAVIAFQKWEGLGRDGRVTADEWSRLAVAMTPTARRSNTGAWVEVNRAKQVLLYVQSGVVLRTLPISTGSTSVLVVTPAGDFKIYKRWPGWRYHVYNACFFTSWPGAGEIAIHGYNNVPTYPASHGCVRVCVWDMTELFPLLPVGTRVVVY
jgi:L,D-transpeptidase catalytic domain/Putative peptidoglycan binding domain